MKKPIKSKKDKKATSSSSSSTPSSNTEPIIKHKKKRSRRKSEDDVELNREEVLNEKNEETIQRQSDSDDNVNEVDMTDETHQSESEKEEEEGEEEEEEAIERVTDDNKVTQTRSNNPSKIVSDGRYRNKQRCLVLSSRGVTARYRHLLEDLRKLMPHHKKDYKLDPSKSGGVSQSLTEICEVMSCNSYLYMECRKRMDAYLWIGLAPHGPSARFYVWNVHTMDELRLTGNCMKGSRPVLSFDDSFENIPHLKLLRTLFIHIFGTPRGHPKSKPFVDRVMGFYYADEKIWVRNYQIVEEQASIIEETTNNEPQQPKNNKSTTTSLVEIGPRFVLNPIKIFTGSIRGQVLFENTSFVSPNEIRAQDKYFQGKGYETRKRWEKKRKERDENLVVVDDPLDSVFR